MTSENTPTSRLNKARIIITAGDPSGIGPEVALKALARPDIRSLAEFKIICDKSLIRHISKKIRIPFSVQIIDVPNIALKKFRYGVSSSDFGRASMEYLDKALDLLSSGQAHGLVTAPINKHSVRLAGFNDFEGHTEYLAKKSGSEDFAMMFIGEHVDLPFQSMLNKSSRKLNQRSLKITLVTRHIALKDVPSKITRKKLEDSIRITERYLKCYFGLLSPRIAVCGLNPHAGEDGIFGSEESEVIVPAIKSARRYFKNVTGPVSPDVVFNEALSGKYDAVVSLYHDQALIPFKLLYFRTGVNCTIGLPFIRTSPDHGTAFDIAGKGNADPLSMIEAIRLACRLTAAMRR